MEKEKNPISGYFMLIVLLALITCTVYGVIELPYYFMDNYYLLIPCIIIFFIILFGFLVIYPNQCSKDNKL